ncbi:MAG: apolipoprotein N-acyltransferase [Sphingomicrobium sp.]
MKHFSHAALLGAITAFAFQPVDFWPLLPIAFAALCELIARAPTLRRALALGWGFGFFQFVIALNWIATSFTYQSNMPAWLGWVAVVLVALYLAIYPALATGLAWRLGRRGEVPLLLALAGSWALTEWLRAGMFTGFAWNPAGVILASTPLISIGALIGTYGLSLLVVLLGGVLWLEIRRKYLPGVAILAATLLLWALPGSRVPDSQLAIKPVRIVQPDIGQHDKWRPEFDEEAARRLAVLSAPRHADGGSRLLFWPEAAVTRPLSDSRPQYQAMAAFERSRVATLLQPGDLLLTGGIGVTASDGQIVDGATNSIFVIDPAGRIVSRYHKAHLLPFGEYLPLRPLLSAVGMSRFAPGDLDFAAGPGPRTIDLGHPWGRVGMQLCYEIIFSGEVVDRNNRPDFIFNPSNDAWFGRWGPPQHLAQARLRAAEEGLPLLRSTPTGISAVIDARGAVVGSLAWRTAGVIDSVLPPPAIATPLFGRFGNIIPLLLALALMIAAIALPTGQRYRRT